jgi:DNA mismatch repair ATPase MutS
MIHLGSVINFEHRLMVRAIGGLLAFIHSNRDSVLSLEGSVANMELRVHSVLTFTLTDFMHMDAVTFSALQIFQIDSHPSAVKAGRSKEGFSLYSLLDRTRSVIGRRILKQVRSVRRIPTGYSFRAERGKHNADDKIPSNSKIDGFRILFSVFETGHGSGC